MDSRDTYRSFFWPVVLIGVGLVWLLVNLGLLPGGSLGILFRLWPLLLIFIGLDLIFARRLPLVGGLLGLLAVLVVIGLMIVGPRLGFAPGAAAKTETFVEPLEGASSAQIELDLWSSPAFVGALQSSENLFEAEVTHNGQVIFQTQGGDRRSIRLGHRSTFSGPFDWFDNQQRADIHLSPDTPLELAVDGGSGSINPDLDALQLTGLEIDGSSGSVNLTLPAAGERYPVNVTGSSGSVDITIPGGAALDLELDSGSGSIDIEILDAADLSLELDTGSGAVRVDVPEGAAVRVEVRDDGSGGLNLGGGLQQVSGGGDAGVWETPGFADAGQQILIIFADRSSGSLTVR